MCLFCWRQKALLEVGLYCCARITRSTTRMSSFIDIPCFKSVDADPGGTLKKFNNYITQMKLLFTIAFRKSYGTAFEPMDNEKKAMTLLKGGDDMRTLFEQVRSVLETDTFSQAVEKVQTKLKERTTRLMVLMLKEMLLMTHLHNRPIAQLTMYS